MARQYPLWLLISSLLLAQPAWAQGLFSGQSTSQSPTTGGGGLSGLTSGLNAAGLGGGRTGAGGTSATGGFSGPTISETGSLASQIGQGFVGRSNTTGNMVGTTPANQQRGAAGQAGANGTRNNFGARGGQAGRQGQGGNNQGFNQQQLNGSGINGPNATTAKEIRPQYRVSFTHSPATVDRSTVDALETRVSRMLSQSGRFAGVVLTPEANGAVVLTGEVDSAESRKMAETMVRMEAGVRKVDNQLAIRAR